MFLGQPTWSPDGKRIAWVEGPPNGYGTVWVADASGQNARPLHQFGQSLLGDDYVAQIEWLRSTSLLVGAALSDVAGLYRLSLSGMVTLVWALPDLPFSTDRARRLVATDNLGKCGFTSCPAEIQVLHLASGKVTHAGSRGDLNVNPALSPDGKRVAYNRAVCYSSGKCGRARGVWLAATSGTGKPHQLPGTGEYFPVGWGPVWSPNGRLLAYSVQGPPTRNSLSNERVTVVALGGKPRTLPRVGDPSVFSPDSRFLAYVGSLTNRPSLYWKLGVLDLRTGHIVMHSPARLGNIGALAWSPDGKKILAVARPLSANPDCQSLYMATVRTREWKLFRACG
jgi:dipeptidyl aminopeptidase/acylaminoacyl peptidase